MKASHSSISQAIPRGRQTVRAAIATVLVVVLVGCPTPIPHCKDTRTYLPSILVGGTNAASEALVIGRLLLSDSSVDPVIIELSQLDDDLVVARTSLSLARDGRFMWGLERGTYVISRVDRLSDYAGGEYRVKASFYPHLRFEAKGTRYVGQASVLLDPDLNDILPDHMFAPGTPRQGRLGVRNIAVSNELQSERNQLLAPTVLMSTTLETALMHVEPVEVYRLQSKERCSQWGYLRPCLLPFWCF